MNSIATKIVFLIGLVALMFISDVQATEFNLIQPDKSTVSFVFKQMNVPVEGSFKRFKSLLNFDPAKPTLAKAEIEIDIASIDAGSDEANDSVGDKLWFNTKLFPVARFVSTSVKPLGNNRFEVTGKMSIKGRTLDAKTQSTFHIEGNNGVFEGNFVLHRGDYGIGEGSWSDFGTVANEVQIKFRLVASATGKK
jgi:polyisoprenoid-binding protein YceI